MTYNLRYSIPLPIGMYDALHAAVNDASGGQEGIVVHLGWETPEGFDIIEVWESKAAFDAFVANVWPRVVARLGQGPVDAPRGEEFALRGLVVAATEAVYV